MATTGILQTAAPAPAPKPPEPADDWYTSYMKSAPGEMESYEAAQAAASTWNVAPNQTVQNQIGGIIKADSPLMQMARTQSLQDKAARGLGNSSLAIGAGQKAVYGAALPIASQDASTYASAARTNAELGTQTSIANAGFTNDASQFNVGARNTASMQQRDAIARQRLQQDQLDADWKKQQSFQSWDAELKKSMQALDLSAQQQRQLDAINADWRKQQSAQDWEAGLKTALQQVELTAEQQRQVAAIDADWKKQQSFQAYDTALKTSMQAADQAGRVTLQQMDNDTRLMLAEMESKYKTGMQASASMADTYQSMIDNITAVMADPNMDAAAKQAAIDKVSTLYAGALEAQEAISGLDLGDIIIFDEEKPPTTPTKPTTPTTPTQPSGGAPNYGSDGYYGNDGP